MENAAAWMMAAIPAAVILRGILCRKDPYGAFLEGARDGLQTALRLAPALAAIMLAIGMMRAGGLMEMLTAVSAPLMRCLNLPPETAAVLLLRPLSGSGSLSMLEEIFAAYGPDSRIGMAASVLVGSTETVFYTMSVYLAATDVKHLPWVLPVSLLSLLAGAAVTGALV